MRYRWLVGVGALALLGGGIVWLLLREPKLAESSEPIVGPTATDLELGSVRQAALENMEGRLEASAAELDATQGRELPEHPVAQPLGIRSSDDRPFPSVGELLALPYFNPQQRSLTDEERQALKDMIAQANQRLAELMQSIAAMTDEHARKLLAEGHGIPRVSGEKVKRSDPSHDVLLLDRGSAGLQSVSFQKSAVPQIQQLVEVREQYFHEVCASIQELIDPR